MHPGRPLLLFALGLLHGAVAARAAEGASRNAPPCSAAEVEVPVAADGDVEEEGGSSGQWLLASQPGSPGMLRSVPPPMGPVPPASGRSSRRTASDPLTFLDPRTSVVRRTPRPVNSRLAVVPHMFGDFIGPDIQLAASEGTQGIFTDMPLVAGSRRTKVADNNSPVTMDRAYFTYQHFHNVLQFDADPTLGSTPRDGSVDRFVIGFERVVFDGPWSIDVRLPLLSQSGFPAAPFEIDGGNLGNLTVTPKVMLWTNDTSVLSAGLGLDLPTGGDCAVTTIDTTYTLRNQAFHLLPFAGWLNTPTDRTFVVGFAQLDLAANGNPVDVGDAYLGQTLERGVYTEQNLLHLDLSGGCWLARDPRGFLNGIAGVAELHYTTTLQDTDLVDATSSFGPSARLVNPSHRQDVLNVTVGLHTVFLDRTAIRVGAVFPLREDDNRLFDSEVTFQVNRQF